MKLFLAVALIFASSAAATADQVIRPLINTETLAGVWEALPSQHPPLLFHMVINPGGTSYLVQATVGYPVYVVRRLLSLEIKDGNIRLHFGKGSSDDSHDEIYDVWIVGSGRASPPPDSGVIKARFCICNEAPLPGTSPEKDSNIVLIKGAWTRDVAEASQKAEELIKGASRR